MKNMNKVILIIILLFSLFKTGFSQIGNSEMQKLSEYLNSKYEKVEVSSVMIKHDELHKIIHQIIDQHNIFRFEEIGRSCEGRSINLLKIGNGTKKILLWSQMHGDEPTATLAILDILNFIRKSEDSANLKDLLSKTEILIIPMINPDGAEKFTRRNGQDIDINRDASRLQTPEGRLLKEIRDKYNPEFAFNLHDQDPYSSVGSTDSLVGLALLAPAYDDQKSTNITRKRAKQLVAYIYNTLENFLPGKISKYDDEFEKRAFGDNVQGWGSSTILIESGGYDNDPGKQFLRKMNYLALLSSFFAIANETYDSISTESYEAIPFNKRKYCDLLIKNGKTGQSSNSYTIDIAINLEKDLRTIPVKQINGRIIDIGDLSNLRGIKEIDASGYIVNPGRFYLTENIDELGNTKTVTELMKNGVTNLLTANLKEFKTALPFAVTVINPENFSELRNLVKEKYFSIGQIPLTINNPDIDQLRKRSIIKLMRPANLVLSKEENIIVIIGGIIKFVNGELINQ